MNEGVSNGFVKLELTVSMACSAEWVSLASIVRGSRAASTW
jgi:tagatose-1,6-bisphosphate aldolase non-catalytic subunit AgaZ/GatZ